jgi:Mg-chelatase subunit ChlD
MLRICLICWLCFAGAITAMPQTRAQGEPRISNQHATAATKPARESSPEASREQEPQDAETLRINTSLVTVPIIATSSDGSYVRDLRQDEFSISEDGVNQEVAFFATVNAPFHVVLLLDTSASTQQKMGLIRQAAIAFVEQLQITDRVKVISFESEVRELSDFTNDRIALRAAINKTVSGQGTKLYDAFELALSSIKEIRGRKAIVLFSDGVDWHSDKASFNSTLQWLDQEGVIVYPIRYETRAETERIARDQAEEESPQLPTIDVIRKPSGTTPTTFPSEEPSSLPTGQPRKTGPLGLPLPAEILRRRRENDPRNDRLPSPVELPPPSVPTDPKDRQGIPRPSGPSGRGGRRERDTIGAMLDELYLTADSYLNLLANKSGGRLLRADKLGSLPDAFAKIAAELRTQYAIGYYPSNKARDGGYRNIKVTNKRNNVMVRARPGYRAPSGG